jgi:succinate-semialdehyde dehydrogenase
MIKAQVAQAGAIAINPMTGEQVEFFPWLGDEERESALRAAGTGFRTWSAWSVEQRAAVLRRVGRYFKDNVERFARTITLEMGKPITQARAEAEKCAALCDWYADYGPTLIADEATSVEGDKAYVSYLPLGVVLSIMPWNFPLWQAMRGTVPMMLAGNAVMLKHAPNCVGSAINVAEAFEAAGAPKGAFSVFNIHQSEVAAVLADDRIAAVNLTGSVRAGAAVAAEAGRNIKKSVLELGGSDAFIVLADADLEQALNAAIAARFLNSGQVCIAAKRMIVEAPIAEEFTARLAAKVRNLKIGDPLLDDTYIGPMARRDLREELDGQVKRSIEEGATLLLGGEVIGPEEANFYAPTVLAGVTAGMTVFREETFGPVVAIIVANDAEHALALANDSAYGLSGAIWTADVRRAKAMARRLESGGVFINGFAASDPRTPIGGIKKSGYGRELSHFGIREFTNAQVVWEDKR